MKKYIYEALKYAFGEDFAQDHIGFFHFFIRLVLRAGLLIFVILALFSGIKIRYVSTFGGQLWQNGITNTYYLNCYDCSGDVKVPDSVYTKLTDQKPNTAYVIREYNGLFWLFNKDVLLDIKE